MEQTWITITEASKLVGLTNSGFHSQLIEERKRENRTILEKREGNRVLVERQSVVDYFARKEKHE